MAPQLFLLSLKLNSSLKPFLFKAELFAQTFVTNSTLDDTGHIPSTSLPSDYFIPKIKILHNDVFQGLSGLDSRKARKRESPLFLKIVPSHHDIGGHLQGGLLQPNPRHVPPPTTLTPQVHKYEVSVYPTHGCTILLASWLVQW